MQVRAVRVARLPGPGFGAGGFDEGIGAVACPTGRWAALRHISDDGIVILALRELVSGETSTQSDPAAEADEADADAAAHIDKQYRGDGEGDGDGGGSYSEENNLSSSALTFPLIDPAHTPRDTTATPVLQPGAAVTSLVWLDRAPSLVSSLPTFASSDESGRVSETKTDIQWLLTMGEAGLVLHALVLTQNERRSKNSSSGGLRTQVQHRPIACAHKREFAGARRSENGENGKDTSSATSVPEVTSESVPVQELGGGQVGPESHCTADINILHDRNVGEFDATIAVYSVVIPLLDIIPELVHTRADGNSINMSRAAVLVEGSHNPECVVLQLPTSTDAPVIVLKLCTRLSSSDAQSKSHALCVEAGSIARAIWRGRHQCFHSIVRAGWFFALEKKTAVIYAWNVLNSYSTVQVLRLFKSKHLRASFRTISRTRSLFPTLAAFDIDHALSVLAVLTSEGMMCLISLREHLFISSAAHRTGLHTINGRRIANANPDWSTLAFSSLDPELRTPFDSNLCSWSGMGKSRGSDLLSLGGNRTRHGALPWNCRTPSACSASWLSDRVSPGFVLRQLDCAIVKSDGCRIRISPNGIHCMQLSSDDQALVSWSVFLRCAAGITQGVSCLPAVHDERRLSDAPVDHSRVVLSIRDGSVYLLDGHGAFVLIASEDFHAERDRLLNHLIMFDGDGGQAADRLCALNGWDRRNLRLHALSLGLTYRQIDVVSPALTQLDGSQQERGCALVLTYVQANFGSVEEEEFMKEVLAVTMAYVANVIRARCSTPLGVAVANTASELQAVRRFCGLLEALRKFHIELHGNTSAARNRGSRSQVSGVRVRNAEGSFVSPFTRSLSSLSLSDASSGSVARTLLEDFDDSEVGEHPLADVSNAEGGNVETCAFPLLTPLSLGRAFIKRSVALITRWKAPLCSDADVIFSGLVEGNASLVLSFLRWRHESVVGPHHGKLDSNLLCAGPGGLDLERLLEFAVHVVYAALCNENIQAAVKMLQSLGQDVATHFKVVLMHTCRRQVRQRIVAWLRSSDIDGAPLVLSSAEEAAVASAIALESRYPSSNYLSVFTTTASKQGKIEASFIERSSVRLVGQDIDDIVSDQTMQRYRFIAADGALTHVHAGNESCLSVRLPVPRTLSAVTNAYSSHKLSWISAWGNSTELALLESPGQGQDSLMPAQSYNALEFAVTHSMLSRSVEWTRGVLDQRENIDWNCVKRILDRALPFIRDAVVSALVEHGQYLSIHSNSVIDSWNPLAILRGLCVSGKLFRPQKENMLQPVGSVSKFHRFFVRLCADFDLPLVFHRYLHVYELALSSAAVGALGFYDLKLEKSWVRMLLEFRLRNFSEPININQLIKSNSDTVFEHQQPTSGEYVALWQKSQVACLASLSQVRVSDCATAMDVFALKLGANDAKASVATLADTNPTLAELLEAPIHSVKDNVRPHASKRGLQSSCGDITLRELLEENVAANLETLWVAELDDVVHSNSLRASVLPVMHDQMDISYLLMAGRPTAAFDLLSKIGSAAFQGCGRIVVRDLAIPCQRSGFIRANWPWTTQRPVISFSNKSGARFSTTEAEYILWYVRTCGVLCLGDPGILASCVFFLQLCGLSGQNLRIDFAAARRMIEVKDGLLFRGPLAKFWCSPDFAKVANLLLRIDDSSASVQKAVTALEIATKDFVQPEGSTQRMSKWLLVTLFCTAHGEPLSSGHLCELAESGDWLQLMYEAQIEQFGPEQIRHIVSTYVRDDAVKSHLVAVVSRLDVGPSSNPEQTTSADISILARVLFYAANEPHTRVSPAFVMALDFSCPLLVIVAYAFSMRSNQPVDTTVFLLSWLLAGATAALGEFCSQIRKWNPIESLPSHEALGILCNCLIQLAEVGNGDSEVVDVDLTYADRAFALFDPNNPVRYFLEFSRQCLKSRWTEASIHLSSFAEAMAAGRDGPRWEVGSSSWVREVAVSLGHSVLFRCLTVHERSQFLNLIRHTDLFPSFEHQFAMLKVLEETGLSEDLVCDGTPNKILLFEMSPVDFLRALLSKYLFGPARHFVTLLSASLLSPSVIDDITLAEARQLVLASLASSSTPKPRVRYIRRALDRSLVLFVENQVHPAAAGALLFDIAMESGFPVDLHLDSDEQLLFLRESAAHFATAEGDISGWEKLSDSVKQTASRALCRQAELEVALAEKTEQSNDVVLDRLIKCRLDAGATGAARAVCSHMNYPNETVEQCELLETLVRAASFQEMQAAVHKIFLSPACTAIVSTIGDDKVTEMRTLFAETMDIKSATDAPNDHAAAQALLQQNAALFELAHAFGRVCMKVTSLPDQILAYYNVSRLLRQPYLILRRKNPMDVLQLLLNFALTEARMPEDAGTAVSTTIELLSVARDLVRVNCLDDVEVSNLVAESYFRLTAEAGHEQLEGGTVQPLEVIDDQALSLLLSLPRGGTLPCGLRLLDLLSGFTNLVEESRAVSPTRAAEVEILAAAHTCFELASHDGGVALVLSVVYDLVSRIVAAKEFALLVRIVMRLRRFDDLTYIFDLLMEHEHFELLLQRQLARLDDGARLALRMTLHRYLQEQVPESKDTLRMVFLRFRMYRQTAEEFEATAQSQLSSLAGVHLSLNGSSNKQAEILLDANANFLDAADNFHKEKCFDSADRCLAQAALISLQLRTPDMRLINLDGDALEQLMTHRGKFGDVLTVARAHGRTTLPDWANALFHQAVIRGNVRFFQEFTRAFPATTVTPAHSSDIALAGSVRTPGHHSSTISQAGARFQLDVKRNVFDALTEVYMRVNTRPHAQQAAFAIVLEHCPSELHKLRLARECNLSTVIGAVSDRSATSFELLPASARVL